MHVQVRWGAFGRGQTPERPHVDVVGAQHGPEDGRQPIGQTAQPFGLVVRQQTEPLDVAKRFHDEMSPVRRLASHVDMTGVHELVSVEHTASRLLAQRVFGTDETRRRRR
jgi:hypothetical protein